MRESKDSFYGPSFLQLAKDPKASPFARNTDLKYYAGLKTENRFEEIKKILLADLPENNAGELLAALNPAKMIAILADFKTPDVGGLEAKMAFDAGADMMTVIGGEVVFDAGPPAKR